MTEELKHLDAELDAAGDRVNDVADALNRLKRTEFVSTRAAWSNTIQAVLVEAVQLGLMLEGLRRQLHVEAEPRGGTVVGGGRIHAVPMSNGLIDSHAIGTRPCCENAQALGKL